MADVAGANDEIDGDEKWEQLFADPRSEQLLSRLAKAAKKEHKAGNTMPMDEYFNDEANA